MAEESAAPAAGGPDWKHGLCSCFENFKLCAVTYIVPCYIFGKTADKINEGDCVKCALATFVPGLNIYALTKVRQDIREKAGIPGSCTHDLAMAWCCPLCTLVQEAREVEADVPGIPEMERS